MICKKCKVKTENVKREIEHFLEITEEGAENGWDIFTTNAERRLLMAYFTYLADNQKALTFGEVYKLLIENTVVDNKYYDEFTESEGVKEDYIRENLIKRFDYLD